jgi:quercetin dioxygenase-like cupin family protein
MQTQRLRAAINVIMVGLLTPLALCVVGSTVKTQSAPAALVVGPGEGRTKAPLNVVGERVLVKIAGADTNARVAFFDLAVPYMSGPPLHQHTREDEVFYVLDGVVTFQIDGKRTSAKAGTTVFAPRLTVHTYQNFDHHSARLLLWVSPAGLDRLFEEMSAAGSSAPPNRALLEQQNAEHGVKIMGPPLSAAG